jgi:acetate kinase
MNILVLNCGSSSVKFRLIHSSLELINKNTDFALAGGVIERIGSESLLTFRSFNLDGSTRRLLRTSRALRTHEAAVETIIKWVISPESEVEGIVSVSDIEAVGHRVVHGGEKLTEPVLITETVIEAIEDCIELAPLHNPHNLKGIEAAAAVFGSKFRQVAVFDTAFHHTLPEHVYLYAIPYQHYRRHRIRRYGFHGISHRYISYRYRVLMDVERDTVKIISIHLGNGCSACAISGGQSVDTSMGMTPLEGLVMGSRSGDIDAAAMFYLAHKEGYTFDELESLLNKQSGLLGISGLTNDMRDLIAEAKEKDDRRAKLAIDLFCYRIIKYIGSYLAVLGGAQAVVFTGGIGENSAYIRERICSGLGFLGIELDHEKNHFMVGGKEGSISKENTLVQVMVIPTNEELIIARDTVRLICES